MRTPDQDERPEPGTADDSLGDGFGTVDQADLNDGYGNSDFYDDSYDDPIDVEDGYETDDTFDDASDDDGGFGTTDDGGLGDVDDDGGSVGEVIPVGSEVSDAEAENILEEILDDVFGDDTEQVIDDMEASSGLDPSEILETLGDAYDDDLATTDGADDGSGVFDNNPFDGAGAGGEVADAADFVSESDFDLNTDGHVDGGDLHEAAHPFDFHVDGG
jgi:hypothetical protein